MISTTTPPPLGPQDFKVTASIFSHGVKTGDLRSAMTYIEAVEVNKDVLAIWKEIYTNITTYGQSVAEASQTWRHLLGDNFVSNEVSQKETPADDIFDSFKFSSSETTSGSTVVTDTVNDYNMKPGRIPIGDPIQFRPGPELLLKVDAFANQEDLTRPEALRELLRKGLNGPSTTPAFSIQEWLDTILTKSVENNASDIHFSTKGTLLRVFIRVNGALQLLDTVSAHAAEDVIAKLVERGGKKLKVEEMATSSFAFFAGTKEVNLRVAAYHSAVSWEAVVHVVTRMEISLDTINFSKQEQKLFKKAIDADKSGLILVCGPTGSGKSTTLISLLNEACGDSKRVVTVENPVEYTFSGSSNSIVTQLSVGDNVKNYTEGIEKALRLDADILLVGEIRDTATVSMTAAAGETGVLTFSSLHTKSVADALVRLVSMYPSKDRETGVVEKVIDNINVIICQTLLPVYCPAEHKVSSTAKGCEICNGGNRVGRVGLRVMAVLTPELKEYAATHIFDANFSWLFTEKLTRKGAISNNLMDVLENFNVDEKQAREALGMLLS